jgi:hypothetical protein
VVDAPGFYTTTWDVNAGFGRGYERPAIVERATIELPLVGVGSPVGLPIDNDT